MKNIGNTGASVLEKKKKKKKNILVVARIMKKEYTWENNSMSKIFFKEWEDLRKWDLYKWDVSRNFTNPTDIVLDKKDVIYMDTLQTVLSLSKTY